MSMGLSAQTLDNVQTMRRKDQARRRAQLVDAARALLLEHGALGLRVKDIAARAGISPERGPLLLPGPRRPAARGHARGDEPLRRAPRRRRSAGIDDPRAPAAGRDLRWASRRARRRGQPPALRARRDDRRQPLFATLSAAFFDRQVMLYERVLERGVEAGAFELDSDSADGRSRARRARGRARAPGRARPSRRSTPPPARRCSSPGRAPRPASTSRPYDRAPA